MIYRGTVRGDFKMSLLQKMDFLRELVSTVFCGNWLVLFFCGNWLVLFFCGNWLVLFFCGNWLVLFFCGNWLVLFFFCLINVSLIITWQLKMAANCVCFQQRCESQNSLC